MATYNVTANGPILSYYWEYQLANCANWYKVTANNTTAAQTCYEIYPGAQTVRCTIKYSPNMGPVVQAQPILKINVPPPDSCKLSSGGGVATKAATSVNLIFTMYCQGYQVMMATGMAQEKITSARNAKGKLMVPRNPTADGWGPPVGGNTASFYLSVNGTFVDIKSASAQIMRQVPVGGTFFSYTQDNRLLIFDPCGNQIPCPLTPSFSATNVNLDGTNYKINFN